MALLTDQGWYKSSVLANITSVAHGFSTRMLGDARSETIRAEMMRTQGLEDRVVSRGKQVHGAHVEIITSETSSYVDNTDALVTSTEGITLGVVTADCVPIILLDPQQHIAGAIHAGWKGIVAGVIEQTIRVMHKEGADPSRILVSIGPHISACCYSVPFERARQFSDMFLNETVAVQKGTEWYVDIGKASRIMLMKSGISESHIDAVAPCTSCRNDQFYSYRKDSKDTFGEMLAFISLI